MPTTDWDGDDDFRRAKDNSGFVQDDLADHPAGLGRGYDVGSLTEGLVAYYPMDEGQGQVVHDGGLDNLAQINGATWNGSGQVGDDALSFDGTDDYVDIPNDESINFERTDKFTISFWTYKDANGARIIDKADNSSNDFTGYTIDPDSGSTLCVLRHGGNNQISVSSNKKIPVGEWTHFVWTYDGSSSASGCKLYQNGVKMGFTVNKDSLSSSTTNTVNLNLGASANAGDSGNYYDGKLADVRIYDRALSPSEVSYLYEVSQSARLTSEKKTL